MRNTAIILSLLLTFFGFTVSLAAPTNDLGIDIGTVNHPTQLLQSPSSGGSSIGWLQVGATTFLTTTNASNGRYNVIQYSIGRQGWVLGTRLDVNWTSHRTYNLPSDVQHAVDATQPPIIRVTNGTLATLYFHLGTGTEVPVQIDAFNQLVDKASELHSTYIAEVDAYNAAKDNLNSLVDKYNGDLKSLKDSINVTP